MFSNSRSSEPAVILGIVNIAFEDPPREGIISEELNKIDKAILQQPNKAFKKLEQHPQKRISLQLEINLKYKEVDPKHLEDQPKIITEIQT